MLSFSRHFESTDSIALGRHFTVNQKTSSIFSNNFKINRKQVLSAAALDQHEACVLTAAIFESIGHLLSADILNQQLNELSAAIFYQVNGMDRLLNHQGVTCFKASFCINWQVCNLYSDISSS
jgi:hypothetical protein